MRNKAVLVVLPVLAACAVFGPSLLPPWRTVDHLKLPHGKHAGMGVECVSCHEAVPASQALGDNLVPGHAKCQECHDVVNTAECTFCHTDPKTVRVREARYSNLNFAHKNHIERVKGDCQRCHVTLPEAGKNVGLRIPMSTCRGCHNHNEDYQAGNCDKCHKDLNAEKVKLMEGFAHQGNFGTEHRLAARSSSSSCFACHTQAFCVDCHTATPAVRVEVQNPDAVTRQFIHRNDWLSRHYMEAEADPAQCYRCHQPTFCADCHKRQNLTPSASDPRNPHPRDWVMPGSREFHGTAARRDIARCAACHDNGAQSNCVSCHRVGAVGGNPHPPGWNIDHNRQDIRLNGMCQSCHG